MAIELSVRGRRLHEYFVHVAPRPILAALEASNEWMLRFVKVLRGVLVRRLITAPDVATREAEAKMHPTRVHLETLLAPLWCAWGDVADLIEMAALRFRHHHSMKIVSLPRRDRVHGGPNFPNLPRCRTCCDRTPTGHRPDLVPDERRRTGESIRATLNGNRLRRA